MLVNKLPVELEIKMWLIVHGQPEHSLALVYSLSSLGKTESRDGRRCHDSFETHYMTLFFWAIAQIRTECTDEMPSTSTCH